MQSHTQIGELGDAYECYRHLKGPSLLQRALEVIKSLEYDLGYKFRDPMILVEALTHRSAKEQLEMGICYEKLEVLGDSILDYLCNYGLIRYTMFEKYGNKDP